MEAVNKEYPEAGKGNLGVGSTIFAVKPGDGSAREQAASCQKVLGGWANIANEYATGYVVKESGLVPFTVTLGELTDDEREIILKGCLINYNRK